MRLTPLPLITTLLCAAHCAASATTIWCEAELFQDRGGWLHDAQFIDQMGSPFLMAYGLEGPCRDASTKAEVPRDGKYRLWVRSRDWLPEFSPGRFHVLLAGKPVAKIFGEGKGKGWVWEDGGLHDLKAGTVEIGLRDMTGHYGRCDAIVLTDEEGYRPPDDIAALAEERIARGGVSREIKTEGPFDTVVVGGGLAGTFAAVASARLGCKTALIQNRPVLGGNTSDEILVEPQGDTTREPLDPREGGIIEEIRGPAEEYSERMLALCQREPNLALFLDTHATGVEKADPRRIAAVSALCTTTKQRLRFPGRIVIDCTGDGAIGVWAGAEWRHGREPRSMYNETRAPEVGDERTMGGTLRYATEKADEPVAFRGPDWAHRFLRCEDFNTGRHPKLEFGGWQWVIEYGGQRNTYTEAEEIRDELLRIIWGMWDHAKNHCEKLANESPLYRLTWVSHVVGKRESRRIIGDYVMTEHDIAKQTLFPDRVSYAGWGIDIHPPGGFYDTEPPATFSHKVKFSVPFRSLYSKDIDNLMMAGRCISVSHAALGATRVMITCGLQGQAVGTAAALCSRLEAMPRAIGQKHIAAVQQQLLKDGCYIIDMPNEDPRDLARTARASASSVSPPIKIERPKENVHTFTCDRAVAFKVDKNRIGTIALFLHSENTAPTPTRLTLRPASGASDFSGTADLASAEATVPPRSKGWVTFNINADVKPGYYYAWLPKRAGLAWALTDEFVPDTARAYGSAKEGWHPSGETYAFKIDAAVAPAVADSLEAAPPPPADMFAPSNAINGFARAIRGTPNSWRPDPKAAAPHWLELDFGKAVTFDVAHVSFQTKELRANGFRLEASRGETWESLAEIRGNAERRRVITFPPATAHKLRLVILDTEPNMGVCEIRVYDERNGR
ncbi:MAG: FAD-dependent oxidoreductase [Verrucomicrobiae bacterium]|nr:FAD-dependent oxidoreductase [Verrucomicrobiae bacterium]